jgi:hypothetical protein
MTGSFWVLHPAKEQTGAAEDLIDALKADQDSGGKPITHSGAKPISDSRLKAISNRLRAEW